MLCSLPLLNHQAIMYKIYLLFSILTICQINEILAQSKYIYGQVIDSKEGKPLPNASIRISTKGTTSDTKGNFKLSVSEFNIINKNKIIISHVGYESKEFPIEFFTKQMLISLDEKSKDLNEVIVSSSARQLVEEAIRKIPDNYSNQSILIRGILSEKNKQIRNENLYELKAIISGKIPAYQTNEKEIDTKIDAFEKRSAYELDTIEYVRWGGTGKIIEYFDFVKQRVSCIDLHKTKNYKYFIQDIIQKAGRPTYKILVSKVNKKKQVVGNIFIDQESLAFESFDFFKNEEDSTNKKNLATKTINESYITQYKLYQSKWYLSEIKVSLEREHKGIPTYINVNFLATEYDSTNIDPLSYQEKYQNAELLSNRNNSGTNEQWLNIQSKIPTDKSDYLHFDPINSRKNTETTTLNKSVIPFSKLPKLSLKLGLTSNPLTSQFQSIDQTSMINSPVGYSIPLERFTQTNDLPSFNYGFLIRVWKNLEIGFDMVTRIGYYNNSKPTNLYYTLQYSLITNKKHRPISISPNINYGSHSIKRNLGEFTSTQQQREFLGLNDEKLKVQMQTEINSLTLGLDIGLELNKRKYFLLGFKYTIPGNDLKEDWVFRETKGIFSNHEKRINNEKPYYRFNHTFSISLTFNFSNYAK